MPVCLLDLRAMIRCLGAERDVLNASRATCATGAVIEIEERLRVTEPLRKVDMKSRDVC